MLGSKAFPAEQEMIGWFYYSSFWEALIFPVIKLFLLQNISLSVNALSWENGK